MNWISVKSVKKPTLGSKVLIKQQFNSGRVNYHVAIYVRSSVDKRTRAFYQNSEYAILIDGITAVCGAFSYLDVVSWCYIDA